LLLPFFYTGVVTRNNPIYLIGMMGVGKSTVGARLAVRLGRAFLDTDQEVERVTGRTIAEIFETEGESRFRVLEAEAIQAATAKATVVALGGGAVTEPGAMERLLARGEVIFLMADPKLLIDRIGDPASRPLLSGLDHGAQLARLEALLVEREPFYLKANIRVDAMGSAEEVVDRIVDQLDAESDRAKHGRAMAARGE
jgi:shikimate kinase